MFEAACFGLGIQLLEAFRHAVEAEFCEQVEGRMGQHAGFPFNGSSRGRADWGGRHGLRSGVARRGVGSWVVRSREAMLL